MANEKRLIDACALNRNIDCCDFESSQDYYTICEQITQAPTVDAMEVVRCRDCKHYHPYKQSARYNNIRPQCCRSATVSTLPDDFCSYGERKDK